MAEPVTADEVRRLAAEMVRALAADAKGERALHRAADDQRAGIALAAVDALEALSGTVEDALDGSPVAPAVRLAIRSAWERLESAGIRRDGAVGEPLDLARHRVVARRRAAGRPGTVCEVVSHGVLLGDRRLREAAVCVVEEG